ncbi:MAG TPA: hypothetical protein VNT27_16845 [Propionibacteriaceae bacterium]|nr:hypothetical protein [Propionibacteriaceae bacterium]
MLGGKPRGTMDYAAWTSAYRAAVAAGVVAGLPLQLQDAAWTVRGHVAVAARRHRSGHPSLARR